MTTIQDKLKTILNNIEIEPSQDWVKVTRHRLDFEINKKNVTQVNNFRKLNILYFLNLIKMKKSYKILLATTLTFVMLIGTNAVLYQKANASAPGDALYNLDQIYENIQRKLTLTSKGKLSLELQILQERSDELEQLLDQNVPISLINEAVKNLVQQENKATEQLQDSKDDINAEEEKEYQSKIQNQIQMDKQIMEQTIKKYEKDDDKEEKERLENTLKEHEKNLEHEKERNENQDQNGNDINSNENCNTENTYEEQNQYQNEYKTNADNNPCHDSDKLEDINDNIMQK